MLSKRFFPVVAVTLALIAGLGQACAQDKYGKTPNTIDKIRSSGNITLGYREFSVPFSYLSTRGEPVGYSIDLCRAIVDAISRHLKQDISIAWERVTSETRMEAITSGRIDLECGSTTANAERAKHVDFSPIIFVAGTKLMVRKNSTIHSFRDLSNKVIAVTAGTTNERVLHELRDKFRLNYAIVASHDHEESYDLLIHGEVDAFATDDVLLSGMIAKYRLQKDYRITGEYLSYDPYGIMFRKGEATLKKLIETTFSQMAKDHELDRLYDTWFMRKLPSGDRIDLPMSPHLDTIFRLLAPTNY